MYGSGSSSAPPANKRKGDFRQQKKRTSRKNQIRNLERLLKRPNIEPEMAQSLSEKIALLKEEVDVHAHGELEKKRVLKYVGEGGSGLITDGCHGP